jgi:hypothetical protein
MWATVGFGRRSSTSHLLQRFGITIPLHGGHLQVPSPADMGIGIQIVSGVVQIRVDDRRHGLVGTSDGGIGGSFNLEFEPPLQSRRLVLAALGKTLLLAANIDIPPAIRPAEPGTSFSSHHRTSQPKDSNWNHKAGLASPAIASRPAGTFLSLASNLPVAPRCTTLLTKRKSLS